MKPIKIILCAALIVGVMVGWYRIFTTQSETHDEYSEYLTAAEKSYDKRLYEQAIEQFKSAIAINDDVEIWKMIESSYEALLLQEQSVSKISRSFISDMLTAIAKHPKELEFYYSTLKQQMNNSDYKAAKKLTDTAVSNGINDEKINDIALQLKYMISLNYKRWDAVLQTSDGYYVANDDDGYVVINSLGDVCIEKYEFIGAVNKKGYTVVKNSNGFRLIDANSIEREILPDTIISSGVYDETTQLLPLLISGYWQYFKVDDCLLPDIYDKASAFANQNAVVSKDGTWYLISSNGSPQKELLFEDIKLTAGGEYIRSGIIVAKRNGVWSLFNENFQEVGNLSADEIDICLGNNIAFRQGDKWGFADMKGNVVCEPMYSKAMSFSNGLAGVCLEDGLWGFVDSNFRLVISAQFLDVGYFSSEGTCFVSEDEEYYQMVEFVLK